MKSHTSINPVQSNTQLSTAFREVEFVQTAEAFDLYSKKLYKYPLRAFLREAISNGSDSHIRRGNGYEKVPVLVVLPTTVSPVLEVRDYGTSMTFEQVT